MAFPWVPQVSGGMKLRAQWTEGLWTPLRCFLSKLWPFKRHVAPQMLSIETGGLYCSSYQLRYLSSCRSHDMQGFDLHLRKPVPLTHRPQSFVSFLVSGKLLLIQANLVSSVSKLLTSPSTIQVISKAKVPNSILGARTQSLHTSFFLTFRW